jgi:hypothetical protein
MFNDSRLQWVNFQDPSKWMRAYGLILSVIEEMSRQTYIKDSGGYLGSLKKEQADARFSLYKIGKDLLYSKY